MVLIPSSVLKPASAAGPSYLNSVLTSVVFEVDATLSASYGGSGQTWSNVIAAPADGETQTKYDFWLGAGSGSSTDDPTFTGSAGSASAYFSYDGGDYNSGKMASLSTFINSVYKAASGLKYWYGTALRFKHGTGNQMLITANGGGYGFFWYINSSDQLVITTNAASNVTSTVGTLTDGTDYLILFSYDKDSNNLRYWINTTTSSSTARTQSGANSTTVTKPTLFAFDAGSAPPANGTRVYWAAMGNDYLDNTKAASVYSHIEARHSRDYTP